MTSHQHPIQLASITSRLTQSGLTKWALHTEARQRKDNGEDIIELTIGEPDMPPPSAVIEAAVSSLRAGHTYYAAGRGTDKVLAALTKKYSLRTNRVITPRNLIYFPGTQCALFTAMMSLVEIGDEAIVPDPQYPTYDGVVRASGAKMVTVPLRPEKAFHLDANDLEKVITPQSRVLLLNTPHNPTGATLTAQEIADIVAVCEQHNLWIICDEVYEHLVFDAHFASPFDTTAGSQRTIVVSSISKSHMLPGFRSGWCVGPEEIISRILSLSEMMLFGAQPFLQEAAALAIANDFAECRAQLDALADRANVVLSALHKAPGIQIIKPQGGMFILVDVSATGLDGDAFAWRLLNEQRVAVMPGGSFGNMASNFIRISLGHDKSLLLEACQRLRTLSKKLVNRKSDSKFEP